MEKLLVKTNLLVSRWKETTGRQDVEPSFDCLQRLVTANAKTIRAELQSMYSLEGLWPEWQQWMPLLIRNTDQLVIYHVNIDQASENCENYLIYRECGDDIYLTEWDGDYPLWIEKLAAK